MGETFDEVAGAEGGEQLAPETPRTCPSCGSEDVCAETETGEDGQAHAWVYCLDCGMRGPSVTANARAGAIRAWNKLPRGTDA